MSIIHRRCPALPMLPKRHPLLRYLLLLLLLQVLVVLLVLRVGQEQGRVVGGAGSKAIHYHVMTPITDTDIIHHPPMGERQAFPRMGLTDRTTTISAVMPSIEQPERHKTHFAMPL